jgi:predicted porin
MKKTLIALAAVAVSSAAMAQVTISGLLDVSVATVGGDATTATTKGTFINASRGSATSGINFNITEDLGGGMKAQGFYSIDPRGIINDPAAQVGRHEAYVGLSGGFGNIRMGSVNTASLSVLAAGGPFGTATGSGFAEIHAAGGGNVRFANSVRYDAPTLVNGLALNVTYAAGNKDALAGGANPSFTDVGAAFTSGPLQISFSSLSRSATNAQAVVAAKATELDDDNFVLTSPGTAAVAAGLKSTVNTIAANYTMGALRLMAGMGKGDMGTAATDNETTRMGATYTMGTVALHVQQATLQIGTAAKRTATGVRADYALSKRTTAYAGYEGYDSGAATSNNRNTSMVGVRHSF